MNNLTESEIEEIIYKSPWLLDERFIIPNILGSRKEKGRQINIGCNDNRYIDLLFKDTRDNRPVIVELKKESLNRDAIAQILEYRGYINLLNDERKEEWEEEFGINYFCPKMILIGKTVDEATHIAANLAGVEIRLFENEEKGSNEISYKSIMNKLQEWNDFRNSGNRILSERSEWVEEIIDWTNNLIEEKYPLIEVVKLPKVSNKAVFYEQISPFLNLPIRLTEEIKIGIYEYYDEILTFNESFFYCDFEIEKTKFSKETIDLFIKSKYRVVEEYNDDLILMIPRKILENEADYNSFLVNIIEAGYQIELE